MSNKKLTKIKRKYQTFYMSPGSIAKVKALSIEGDVTQGKYIEALIEKAYAQRVAEYARQENITVEDSAAIWAAYCV